MKKRLKLFVLLLFICGIGVIALKAADKTAKDMQAKPRKLGFIGRNRPIPQTVTLSSNGWTSPSPVFSSAVAFDSSAPLTELAKIVEDYEEVEKAEDMGFIVEPNGFTGDDAVQSSNPPLTIPGTTVNFEGLSNEDNFNTFGFRVVPPDPSGDVGKNHYVELINLILGIYDKKGNKLLGPVAIGAVWQNFAISDCEDPSGDPIVLYDQHVNRWLLSQFTTAASDGNFYNCVAISQTPDPLGRYYRYAFSAGPFFPDYPKYGVWTDSYVLTSRDFGPAGEYGISVYALEKAQMISGKASARAVQFFLDFAVVDLNLIGDGLLPADWDGTRRPQDGVPIPIVGTQDVGAGYGATFDALNVYNLNVHWNSKTPATATLDLVDQLATDAFDSIYPCSPGSRDCLPEPGVSDPTRWLDILSYRQRPTFRLAYRNFGTYEALVTNQSVEAAPSQAGVRWYEIRRTNGTYSIYQQGTYAPADGVHRWMGSIAQDKVGNMALGYSVTNATTVFPGIRYTGRLNGDTLGEMTLGEGVVINGTGYQNTTSSRWGDYTSMNIDPNDDCTFWYVNEYYQINGIIGVNTVPWQTRIGSFKLPNCK